MGSVPTGSSRLLRCPRRMVFDPEDLTEAETFLEKKGKLALKRRLGRGGRGF